MSNDGRRSASISSNSFSLLPESVPNRTVVLRQRSADSHEQLPSNSGPRTRHVGRLSKYTIALYFEESDDPTIMLLVSQIILGRVANRMDRESLFDLSRQGATEHGVSRRHAALIRTATGIFIEDMNSNNGTWVNGVHLKPYAPAQIHSGDQIRLGKLRIEVYLPEELQM